jgi:hypothetical protein
MPIEYLLPMSNSYFDQDFFPTHIMINMVEFKHLDETHQETTNQIGTRQWNTTLQAQ